MTRFVLCADDYGISPAVSAGIAELARAGRISATSCMVDFVDELAIADLQDLVDDIDVGLHLDFTSKCSYSRLLRDAYSGRLERESIRAEVQRQLARFFELFGRAPAHIDGHQHVHILPVIRDLASEAAEQAGTWLRITTHRLDRALFARPHALLSLSLSAMSQDLARLAREKRVTTNAAFRGTRSFRERTPYRFLFRRMIANMPEGGLVICHPGRVDPLLSSRDPVTAPRVEELSYFSGEDYLADLREAGLALARMRDIAP